VPVVSYVTLCVGGGGGRHGSKAAESGPFALQKWASCFYKGFFEGGFLEGGANNPGARFETEVRLTCSLEN
jgi:hypothetical protein